MSDVGIEEVRENSTWYLMIGIVLAILGVLAIGAAALVTGGVIIAVGVMILLAGVLQAGHAFMRKKWKGFFLDLIVGLVYAAIGVLCLIHPFAAAAAITLLIAISLILGGIFRIAAAFAVRPPHWLLVLINGAVGLLLGVLIAAQWPFSGVWVIGLFVGIDLVFSGMSLIFLSISVGQMTPAPAGDSEVAAS
ncbi:HdeD family acid-resistance protein [Stratiformator vulcanicus]|nr:DUF308 domain-containing protein [Stratiformator vulcanicus]